MDYQQLIQKIKDEERTKILLFGPPRSGTTIASYIFHKCLGYKLIPEQVSHHFSLGDVLKQFDKEDRFIFHANKAILYFDRLDVEGSLNVLLRRNKEDVLRSARRVNRLGSFNHFYAKFGPGNYVENYMAEWERRRPNEIDYVELDYSSLKQSPYWIPPKKRKKFGIKQVTLDTPNILNELEEKQATQRARMMRQRATRRATRMRTPRSRRRFGNL